MYHFSQRVISDLLFIRNPPFIRTPPLIEYRSELRGGSYKIILVRWRRRRKFWWVFIDFSIENVICECKNVKIFACGALECGRSSKNLIKPLILVKIGAEGAEKIWGFWEFIRTPPLIEYRSELRGGFL